MGISPTVLVVSANLGNFEKPINEPNELGELTKHEQQSVKCDFFTYTDENFPPRISSMTPRLQARIPKMMAWQMKPGYDYYLWIDSSCRLAHKDAVKWFLEQIGDKDMAVFKHPHRKTVGEEADYLKKRLAMDCPYITPRYNGERIDDQLAVVNPYDELYASTAFIYKNDTQAKDALTIWWLHTSLYHSIDQLSLPHAIKQAGAEVNVIPDNYLKGEWIEYVRNK